MKSIRSKYTRPDFQFIRFRLGPFEFGIEIGEVKEILRLKEPRKAEKAPGFIEGLINMRSMTLPVMDLRKRFSFQAEPTETARIIVASIDSLIIGLIVDEVSDIALGAKEVTLKPEPSGSPWDDCLEVSVETGSGKVLIINPSKVFTDEEKRFLACPVNAD
ncbi:MAG: purine-binding chemotaxis protein CheW [Deltaproteobacteria bacterium]|nr:purine-binding chemotaxis protein CheW [Deltaproteobacteria bacterium]MBZ0218851.1 chemotaxis protein CheW [Deltaproteobacteria bacterium]